MLTAARPRLPDRAFIVHAGAWMLAAGLAYGLVSAIIPNPVFGRQIPPEPFAYAVWLLSAPLLGVLGATYTAPMAAPLLRPMPLGPATSSGVAGTGTAAGAGSEQPAQQTSWLGTLGSLGAFFAIGCPICNKLVLLLLGTSGAIAVYAPLQPVLGAVSLGLLAGSVAWRLRIRARGGACPT